MRSAARSAVSTVNRSRLKVAKNVGRTNENIIKWNRLFFAAVASVKCFCFFLSKLKGGVFCRNRGRLLLGQKKTRCNINKMYLVQLSESTKNGRCPPPPILSILFFFFSSVKERVSNRIIKVFKPVVIMVVRGVEGSPHRRRGPHHRLGSPPRPLPAAPLV